MSLIKYVTVFTLTLFSGLAVPQEFMGNVNVSLSCFETKGVYHFLNEEYKETPAIGLRTQDKDLVFVLLMNKKDKTWTIVSTKDKVTCIIGMGKDFVIVPETFDKTY